LFSDQGIEVVGPQSAVNLEEDLQDGDERGKRKDVQHRREDVEHDG
jgi:hypothetical protein